MNKEITIRAMKMGDIGNAIELWKESFQAGFSASFDSKEMIEKYMKRNCGLSSVAIINNQLVGALMCGHDGRRGSIYHTAVFDKFRGCSIGKLMEKRSINELRKEGITTGFLFININNPGSREFWESSGWEVIEEVRYLYKQF